MTAELERLSMSAKALLATVHHLMTGHEIHVCESLAVEPDYFAEVVEVTECGCPHCRGCQREVIEPPEGKDAFGSLLVQFSREIAEWIDEQNRDASRRAIDSHARLFPEECAAA